MKKTGSILVFLLLISVFSHAQRSWYVSPGGSDNDTGLSENNAFSTIGKAIDIANCGDTIQVLSGFYIEKIVADRNCTDNLRLRIIGDSTARPTIRGNPEFTSQYTIEATGSGFVFEHLELLAPSSLVCDPKNTIIYGDGSYFDFIDVIVRDAGYDGIRTSFNCPISKWANNWRIVDSQILSNGEPCTDAGNGIDLTHCVDCEIINTRITDNNEFQILIADESNNVLVDSCFIRGRGKVFRIGKPGLTPQCDLSADNAKNITISENVIINYSSNQWPFMLGDVSMLEIVNNTVIFDSLETTNRGFLCLGECEDDWGDLSPSMQVQVINNIFADLSNVSFDNFGTDIIKDPFDLMSTFDLDYNLYFDSLGGIPRSPDPGMNSSVGHPDWCEYPDNLFIKSTSPAAEGDPNRSLVYRGAFPVDPTCLIAGLFEERVVIPSLELYPNPVFTNGRVIFMNEYSGPVTVRIISVQGIETYNLKLRNARPGQLFVDLGNVQVQPGVYILEVSNNTSTSSARLIIR